MNCKIYTLEHPETGEVRYVGKTGEPLFKRLAKHVYESKHSNSHRANWINSLCKNGMRPKIDLLEEVGDDWVECEKYWIAQFKAWGFNLVNGTEGGDSVYRKGETFEQKYGEEGP